jgi:hypothetical protein
MDTLTRWKLKAKTDSLHSVRDLSGNIIPDSVSFSYFSSVADKDSTIPVLTKVPVTDSSTSVDPARAFEFLFNTSVKQNDFKNRFRFFQQATKNDVNFSLIKKADNYFLIKPVQELNSDEWYELDFKADSIFSMTGIKTAKDTTYKMRFKTKDIRSFSVVSGIVKNIPNDHNKYYVIMRSKDLELNTIVNDNGAWEFSKVPPGTYTFEIFCDKDGNGKFSYGESFPYKFSEPFTYFDKEYEIKPRWVYKDILLLWLN